MGNKQEKNRKQLAAHFQKIRKKIGKKQNSKIGKNRKKIGFKNRGGGEEGEEAGGGGKGCGSATLIAEFGTSRTSRSSQVIGSLFQSFSQLPQADGAFKIQCLLSVPFLFQLRTQQQQLQLLTYTHGTYPNIYMYRCNTIRRLAVDPHISTVTFLIKCRRLCLCFVLVLFPNLKLWFILVWQSFFSYLSSGTLFFSYF